MKTLHSTTFETLLGTMLAIADENFLYLLEFTERKNLTKELKNLQKNYAIVPGTTKITESIKQEIKGYFAGKLQQFKTPIKVSGTPFQEKTWQALAKIPFGSTQSYAQQAISMHKPKACRAVAKANSTNQLVIIIPCHRIINKSGKLGGYAAGLARKQWLLEHEKQVAMRSI
ncbi:MAG: methylated-DNA--[protein]-cysteine S-methyltransferase [Candidatus Babeliales bacterium]